MPAVLGGLRVGAALVLIACTGSAGTTDARAAAVRECDPTQQTCAGAGDKCVDERCVPDGRDGLGAACVDDEASVDSCRAGLLCSPLGVATSGDGREPRRCRAYCDDDRDCAPFPGERCAGSPVRPGVCVTPCTLFARDCPDGRTCEFPLTGSDFSTCRHAGPLAIGEPCFDRPHDCPDEAICLSLLGAPTVCHRLCDTLDRGAAQRPCPGGAFCQRAFGQPIIGVCPI